RSPNYLPPPDLRERILNSTTRRKRLTSRFRPGWWQWAPALGAGLLAAWFTLPHAPQESPSAQAITTRPEQTVIATIQPSSREQSNEPTAVPQVVVVVESSPEFRVVQAEPRWVSSTRISTVSPMAPDSSNTNVAQSAAGSTPSTPIVTAIVDAEPSEPVILPTPTVSVVSTMPTANNAPSNPSNVPTTALSEWRKEFNEQLRRDRRIRLNENQHTENPSNRFVVPIVSINLR
ncbi:MAG: hypothetical protein SNJ72_09035, partial [Fimbriimonadales bacterium]